MFNLMVLNGVYSREEGFFRYLTDADEGYVMIDIDDNQAMPKLVTFEQIDKEVRRGSITEVEDSWLSSVNRHFPSEHKHSVMRDKNFESIKSLVTHPDFYQVAIRGAITQILVEKGTAAKSTLYRYARRYWQRGQHKNALLPDYAKCGGKGKKKTRGDKPLGRPNETPGLNGVEMSPALESLMHSAVMDTLLSDRYRIDLKAKKKNLFDHEKAYVELLLRYCKGNTHHLDDRKPSKALFKWYYYEKFTLEQRAQAKNGKKYFSANNRALTSTVRANLVGPGQSIIIDSTPLEIGAANEGRFPLGRPTLYAATDEFSSAIVGFLLVLTPPSYFNAVNCMTVAVCPKEEFCRSLGMEKYAEQWIMEGLPQAFFYDLGSDFKTKHIEQFVSVFHRSIKNSGAGQPEKRAVGEKVFDRIHAQINHKAPGVVSEYLPKKAGGKNSQAEYTLCLGEINKLLLKAVITLNNKPIEGWDSDADFPSELAKTPNNIWKWGIANRTGLLQPVSRKHFWFSMLKREEATVNKNVLKIDQVQFVCPNLSGIRVKKYHLRQKVFVVRDMNDASAIYLVPSEGRSDYIRCELSPYHRRYKGIPWADVLVDLKIAKDAHKNAMHNYHKTSVDDLSASKEMVTQAKLDKTDKIGCLSKPEKLRYLGDKSEQRNESSKIYLKIKPNERPTEQEIHEPVDVGSVATSKTQFFMDDED